MKQQTKILLP